MFVPEVVPVAGAGVVWPGVVVVDAVAGLAVPQLVVTVESISPKKKRAGSLFKVPRMVKSALF